MNLYKALRPAIFKMDAETAHGLTIRAMKSGLMPCQKPVNSSALRSKILGLEFDNPVGLSAGFDKNADVIPASFKMGFGFVEAGTVTPKPQDGNPKPRIFRDPKNGAVINRMGFPNGGADLFETNIKKTLSNPINKRGIIGINIGMNKTQTDPAADYSALIERLGKFADYLTINISSPNTPGLRNLQSREPLMELIERVQDSRTKHCPKTPPLLVKFAPDLTDGQCKELAQTCLDSKIDGIILTNTTLDRPDYLPEDFRGETGGLSGAPVKDKSTKIISKFYQLTNAQIPIIGVGGIASGKDAYEKIKAGASLIQLYSALVFHGPALINQINRELIDCLKADGHAAITDAVGTAH